MTLVKTSEKPKTSNYRRLVFEQVFKSLVDVQQAYHNLTRKLIKASMLIPKDKQQVDELEHIDRQIEYLNSHISKLEQIKFYCSMTILTEGSVVTSTELGHAIELIELFLEFAYEERKSKEDFISSWALQKIELFEELSDIMLQIFESKTKRQQKVGEVKIH